jgi:hypothetical protein
VVGRGDGSTTVEDKQNERRFIDCNFRLLKYALRDFRFLAGHDSAGVYHLEGTSVPIHWPIYAIARDARFVGDDRPPLSNQTVEERRLADIWAADDGYKWKRSHKDFRIPKTENLLRKSEVVFAFLFEDSTSKDGGPELSDIRL